LLLVAVGFIIPALFPITVSNCGVAIERELSIHSCIVLLTTYVLCIMFKLKIHTHVFAWEAHDASDLREQFWSCSRSIGVPAAVMVFVAAINEM